MKLELLISDSAKADLEEILTYTRIQFGETQAAKYRGVISAALLRLSEDPKRPPSRKREDLRAGLWSMPMPMGKRRPTHYVYFRLGTESEVRVLRVLHASMDEAAHLSEEP